MPDPRIARWTAAWNLAVDAHILSPSWLRSMEYLDLSEEEREFLEAALRACQQLPPDAGPDVRLLVDAKRNHDLEKLREFYAAIPASRLHGFESLVRGEAKTLRPDWDQPFTLVEPDDDGFDDEERATSKLPYARHLGSSMERQPERVTQVPAGRHDTMPVPRNYLPLLVAKTRPTPIPPVPDAEIEVSFNDDLDGLPEDPEEGPSSRH